MFDRCNYNMSGVGNWDVGVETCSDKRFLNVYTANGTTLRVIILCTLLVNTVEITNTLKSPNTLNLKWQLLLNTLNNISDLFYPLVFWVSTCFISNLVNGLHCAASWEKWTPWYNQSCFVTLAIVSTFFYGRRFLRNTPGAEYKTPEYKIRVS